MKHQRRIYVVLAMLACVFGLQGCTSKQLYEAAHENRRNECRKLPLQQQRECFERYDMSYEEYERKRREVIE
ncbi:MAG: hypothetical protein JJU10_00265 [Idiomarina sp.]|nr:hypothetical protein [Idiomarina sp.]